MINNLPKVEVLSTALRTFNSGDGAHLCYFSLPLVWKCPFLAAGLGPAELSSVHGLGAEQFLCHRKALHELAQHGCDPKCDNMSGFEHLSGKGCFHGTSLFLCGHKTQDWLLRLPRAPWRSVGGITLHSPRAGPCGYL